MIKRDTVLELVKSQGPVLPNDIARVTRENLLFISAMLSELVSAKKIKYSSMKIGSSPLYYHQGQEEKLQEYSHKLIRPLQEALEMLKKEKVLKDDKIGPSTRVALRELKDFAQPFTRTTPNGKELFWKFYMVGPEEATYIVREKYPVKKTESNGEVVEKIEEAKPEETETPETKEDLKDMPKEEKEIEIIKVRKEQPAQSREEKIVIPDEPEETEKAETEEKEETPAREEKESAISKELEEMKKELEMERKRLQAEREKILREKEELEKSKKDIRTKKEGTIEDDPLYQQAAGFLKLKGMQLLEPKLIKKGEIEGKVLVPSTIGKILFICRAKSKKRLNKNDLEELQQYAAEKQKHLLLLLQADLPKKANLADYPSLHTLTISEKVTDGSKNN